MKTRVIPITVGIMGLTLLGTLAAAPASSAVDERGPWFPRFRTSAPAVAPTVTVATTLPTVPASVRLMTTTAATVDVAALADGLAVRGVPFRDGDRVTVEGPVTAAPPSDGTGEDAGQGSSGSGGPRDVLTTFPASGGVDFREAGRFSPPAGPQALPSRTWARENAVSRLRALGLLPPDARTGATDVSFATAQLTERSDGRVVQRIDTELEVRFPQYVAGIAVTGPGSKLYVAYGPDRELLGLTRSWRTFTPSSATVAVIPPSQAVDTLRAGQGATAVPPECAAAAVTSMRLAYWAEAPTVRQHTAPPVYEFSLRCTDAAGANLGDYPAYAPAGHGVAALGDIATRPAPAAVTPQPR